MMLLKYSSQYNLQPNVASVSGNRIRIGSDATNDIVLNSPFIDGKALEIRRIYDRWELRAFGKNGCEVAGKQLLAGETAIWDTKQPIQLFPYTFQLQTAQAVQESSRRPGIEQVHRLIRTVHLDMTEQLHLRGLDASAPDTPEKLLFVERLIESSAAHHGVTEPSNAELVYEFAGGCVRDAILSWVLERHENDAFSTLIETAFWSELATITAVREEELSRLKLALSARLFDDQQCNTITSRIERVEQRFWSTWDRYRERMGRPLGEYLALRQIKKHVKDTLFGFGPLEDLLRLPTISEIMVNASDEIFIEKAGVLQNSGRQFVSDEVTQAVIERIVGKVGRRIDTAQPMVDARLPDGSRVNAVIPPLAVKGPCITIRKFNTERLSIERLVEIGSLSAQVQEVLNASVKAKRSVLVSGGTGTGKTTLLNCLTQAVPAHERIICIEDTHELKIDHTHVIFLECRDGNNEGVGRVSIRDLVRNALRQRPDRLIVGECRGDEALDMLQAMNTGHDGSMTTIHANNPSDALRRLEVLVRESGLPTDAVRQQISSAIDVVVQLTRCPDGRRIVSAVDEVIGVEASTQQIRLRPIFALSWDHHANRNVLRPTGCLPTFAPELVRDGHLKIDTFLRGIRSDSLEKSQIVR